MAILAKTPHGRNPLEWGRLRASLTFLDFVQNSFLLYFHQHRGKPIPFFAPALDFQANSLYLNEIRFLTF
jgi:hypothetical protein